MWRQDYSNSSALAMELLQSCTKPLIMPSLLYYKMAYQLILNTISV